MRSSATWRGRRACAPLPRSAPTRARRAAPARSCWTPIPSYSFPAGNGNPWVLIDFLQAPSGLIAQRGGYTPTQPNYVVDHLARGGVDIQTRFWDEHILTEAVRTIW